MPKEPDIDGVCHEILTAYSLISRGRKYAGMTAAPLPLSLSDIDAFCHSRSIMIDRDEFESAIFALDDAFREEWSKKQEKPKR